MYASDNNSYTKNISTPLHFYNYYAFCVNCLAGTTAYDNVLNFGEIQIFGTPIYNITPPLSIIKDNQIFLQASTGGNGGDLIFAPLSGGSGGGAYCFLNMMCNYCFNTNNLGLDNLNNYNLTNVNNVVQNTSIKMFGVSSAQFNGSGYLSCENTGQFTPAITTFSVWYKPVQSTLYQTIASCRGNLTGWVLYQLPNTLTLQAWTGTGSGWGQTNYTLPNTNWVHLVYTFHRNTSVHSIWVNKTLVVNLGSRVYLAENTAPFNIGSISGANTLKTGSYLDNFCFFDRQLTQTEIDYLYTTGSDNIVQGASKGTAFSNIYTIGDVNDGANASGQGGDGGSASTTSYNITGGTLSYSIGGSGATDISTPTTKTNFGSGGDGNGGIGMTGCAIIRCKSTLDYNNNYYKNNKLNLPPQNVNNISIVNHNNNDTNLNFEMKLSIDEKL